MFNDEKIIGLEKRIYNLEFANKIYLEGHDTLELSAVVYMILKYLKLKIIRTPEKYTVEKTNE